MRDKEEDKTAKRTGKTHNSMQHIKPKNRTKNCPDSVASYDTQSRNKAGLFHRSRAQCGEPEYACQNTWNNRV